MSKKVAKNHKPFFMMLLQSVTEMMGPDMAKGMLQRVGINLANTIIEKYGDDSLHVDSLEELVSEQENPLTYLDDTLEVKDGKLMILGACPFAKVLSDYLDVKGSVPSEMNDITKLYNEEGLGYAVSPYCLIHQEYRKTIAEHIRVNGNPIRFLQLACKSASGEIAYADPHLKEIEVEKGKVTDHLTENACAYTLHE